jgi:DNA-binding phage protein
MMTREKLAGLLQGVDVAAVAKAANLSPRTIKRIQKQTNSPNLKTLESILSALRLVNKRKPAKVPA